MEALPYMRIYVSVSVYVHLLKRFHKCAFTEVLPYMRMYESASVYAHLWKHFRK